MSDATLASKTIRAEEAAHFGALAAEWWDPAGSSRMLHRLNPVRLAFIRGAIDMHWGGDVENVRPLAGKSALDVGCGAGLLCEPLARLGAAVTGVDAAEETIAAARAHAAGTGLLADVAPLPDGPGSRSGNVPFAGVGTSRPNPSSQGEGLSGGSIHYRQGELGALGLDQFDLVTCMEVIEHVADKPAFIAQLAAHLAPDGLLLISTPNRTAASRLLLVGAAEIVGMVPRGTHRWEDLIAPAQLRDLLRAAGLETSEPRGIAWRLDKGLHLSDDLSLNYILTARRAG